MLERTFRPTWCEIDLSAVAHNIGELRSIVGPAVAIYVCLKGDALGSGAEAVALRAEAAGANGLTFGNIDSAIRCRQAGVSLPILLYPSCLPSAAPALELYDLMPTVSTLADVSSWSSKTKSKLRVFLKIDAGGLRAGAFPQQAAQVASAVVASDRLELAGVYGHPMTSYGFDDASYTKRQIDGFLEAITSIERAGLSIPVRMVSSSAIILENPSADLNAIDPGRLVLGMKFPAIAEREREWRPALVGLRSRLVMAKSLADMGEVEPAPFIKLRCDMKIGLIPFGWSDGYPREIPRNATALVRGRRAPLLGPVHSELLRIDLTDVPEAEVGDDVVLLGTSGSETITLSDLSEQWGMNELDIYSTIGKTLPRIYLS